MPLKRVAIYCTAKALELFLQDAIDKTAACTRDADAKTMTPAHLKEAITSTQQFDFLKPVVANVADLPEKKSAKKRKAEDAPKPAGGTRSPTPTKLHAPVPRLRCFF
jgi:hypothetical protein